MSAVAKIYRDEYKRRKREYLRELLATSKCADCGTDNSAVLQFHHIVPGTNLKQLVQHRRTWTQLKAEIAKCVVLCANCHIIRHSNEQTGYFAQKVG